MFNLKKKDPNEPKDFVKYYVPPHRKISREVTEKDLNRVKEDGHILYNLCFTQRGPHYKGGFAVAHPQITKKDPLRFFVIYDKRIIINPVIVNHTNSTVDSEEGCLTYPDKPMITVQRWNKCEVEYQVFGEKDDKLVLSEKIKQNLSGKDAKIFQHEIDHLDAKYIYDQEK